MEIIPADSLDKANCSAERHNFAKSSMAIVARERNRAQRSPGMLENCQFVVGGQLRTSLVFIADGSLRSNA